MDKGRVAPRFVTSALLKAVRERQRALLRLGLGLWSLLLRRRRIIGRASMPSTATDKELPNRVQVGQGQTGATHDAPQNGKQVG
jgi:hypothetical protein